LGRKKSHHTRIERVWKLLLGGFVLRCLQAESYGDVPWQSQPKEDLGEGENMIDPALVAAIMVIVLVVIVLAVVSSAIVFIKPNEQGLYFRLGRFVGVLPPGMSFTAPIVSEVKRVDTSLQSFTLSFDDILSSDNMRFALTMKVHYKVTDAKYGIAVSTVEISP